MYPATFLLPQPDRSSRLLLIFRPLLLIPHLFWLLFYGMGAGLIQLLSFWSIVFTARHPRGLWSYLERYFRYRCRVNAYSMLLTDAYPPFSGGGDDDVPVRVHVVYPDRLSRLTVFFRPLLLFPHFFFYIGYAFFYQLVAFLTFWTVLFTGRLADWQYEQIRGWCIYASRIDAYSLYLVDEYPPFNGAQPRAAEESFQ